MFIVAQTAVEQVKTIAEGNYTTTGVLLLVALAFGFGAWKVAVWSGALANKVIDRGIKHLDQVDATMASLKDSIQVIPERLDRIEAKVDGLDRRVDDLDQHISRESRIA